MIKVYILNALKAEDCHLIEEGTAEPRKERHWQKLSNRWQHAAAAAADDDDGQSGASACGLLFFVDGLI